MWVMWSLVSIHWEPVSVQDRCTVCAEHTIGSEIIFDEDITCSDTTTLATFDSQVKQFFIMIVFDTFDELMLHHDVCSFSFSELLTWIKGRFDCIWKAWKVNEVDWGPNPSIPNVLR